MFDIYTLNDRIHSSTANELFRDNKSQVNSMELLESPWLQQPWRLKKLQLYWLSRMENHITYKFIIESLTI